MNYRCLQERRTLVNNNFLAPADLAGDLGAVGHAGQAALEGPAQPAAVQEAGVVEGHAAVRAPGADVVGGQEAHGIACVQGGAVGAGAVGANGIACAQGGAVVGAGAVGAIGGQVVVGANGGQGAVGAAAGNREDPLVVYEENGRLKMEFGEFGADGRISVSTLPRPMKPEVLLSSLESRYCNVGFRYQNICQDSPSGAAGVRQEQVTAQIHMQPNQNTNPFRLKSCHKKYGLKCENILDEIELDSYVNRSLIKHKFSLSEHDLYRSSNRDDYMTMSSPAKRGSKK